MKIEYLNLVHVHYFTLLFRKNYMVSGSIYAESYDFECRN